MARFAARGVFNARLFNEPVSRKRFRFQAADVSSASP